jgi:hypothetical protein
MKTRSFSQLVFEELPDGMCRLYAKSPGNNGVQIELSPDELEIFLVEIINSIEHARLIQVANKARRNLERELQKL